MRLHENTIIVDKRHRGKLRNPRLIIKKIENRFLCWTGRVVLFLDAEYITAEYVIYESNQKSVEMRSAYDLALASNSGRQQDCQHCCHHNPNVSNLEQSDGSILDETDIHLYEYA